MNRVYSQEEIENPSDWISSVRRKISEKQLFGRTCHRFSKQQLNENSPTLKKEKVPDETLQN